MADVLRKNIGTTAPTDLASILGVGASPGRAWLRALISSELDLDRLDFLRRDAYFPGAQYGHFDYLRILGSIRLGKVAGDWYPVWPEKQKYAVEEFVFARFYMYRSVYLHPTTRGYEQLARAILRKAQDLGATAWKDIPRPMKEWLRLWHKLKVDDFLLLDDAVVLASFTCWLQSRDKVLADLSKRFLRRAGLKPFEVRPASLELERATALDQARGILRSAGYDPDYYLLEDKGETRHYRPYRVESLAEEGSPLTAIFLLFEAGAPKERLRELSTVLDRVRHVAGTAEPHHFMFCPEELRSKVAERVNQT